MRSSTGCISQARSAVLAAATPISRKARAIRRTCGRMNSRARRATSATECAPFPRIAGYSRMGSPPAVLEAGDRLGKGGRSARFHAAKGTSHFPAMGFGAELLPTLYPLVFTVDGRWLGKYT